MAESPSRLSVSTCVDDFAGPNRSVEVFRDQGCHVTFDNGWVVSIQWSPFHYCSNRNMERLPMERWGDPSPDSPDAEVAAWKGEDTPMVELEGDTVAGWQPVAHIHAALEAAANDDPQGIRAALTRETSDAF